MQCHKNIKLSLGAVENEGKERKGKKRGRKEMRSAIETIEWKPERAMSFDEEEDEENEEERRRKTATIS